MSVYMKLSAARQKFHSLKLEKTGENKFAGYKYFELGDFLIPALGVFREFDLCAVISFTKDEATMRIVNMVDNSEIVITSPMGSAALKGCHEVQNIGAVETYQRRYLWVAALEIVEHDALDATTGRDKPEVKAAPVIAKSFRSSGAMGVFESLPPKRQNVIADAAIYVAERADADDMIAAWDEYDSYQDDERVALHGKLSAPIRAKLKKHGESLKSTTTEEATA
jgi:hypothetical protein